MDRELGWFKRGFQFDVKCNAIDTKGQKAKPCIVVFTEDKGSAMEEAIKQLKMYGYSNLTVDKIVSHR